MMERISTGVPGLDEILKGGLRRGASVLVVGAPGTGKSILGLQFIYQGAKNNEPGLYLTAEENVSSLRDYAKSLGFDLEKYEKKGMITLLEQKLMDGKTLSIQVPFEIIRKKKIKRVVLDSLTYFHYIYSTDILEFRKGVLGFLEEMKKLGISFLATSEKETSDIDAFIYQPHDFLFEGLILLVKIRKGATFERALSVAKMRGQEHLLDIFPLKITEGGMKVLPKQIPFSLIEKDVSRRF